MPKLLTYGDLDLSGIPECLIRDKNWQRCVNLALCSQGKDHRYGAAVMSRNKVIGVGWAVSLSRAKRLAVRNAIIRHGRKRLKKAVIYAAGIMVKSRKPSGRIIINP